MRSTCLVVSILGTTLLALASASTAVAQAAPPVNPPVASGSAGDGRVGVAVRASTLGVGGDVAIKVNDHVNVRGGFDMFSLSRNFDDTGNKITYTGTVDLQSGHVFLDWFPFGGGFRLSPGLVFANGNKVSLTTLVTSGQSIDIGDTEYRSGGTNPIRGAGTITVESTRPAITFGWGNIVPRTRRFSVPFELGIVFQGAPTGTLTFTGQACALNGLNCRDIATDATIQNDVRKAQAELNDNIKIARFYPVISIGFGLRF